MFKDLIVWQKSMELVRAVYALSKAFPVDERYALTDQLRRAVVSIPSNIAEGSGRASMRITGISSQLPGDRFTRQ